MDMTQYLNIVADLLYGNTKRVDEILHKDDVLFLKLRSYVSRMLTAGVVPLPDEMTLYRGILLEKGRDNTKLLPLDYIKTISFTEDIEVAEDFANPDAFISQFYMQLNPEHTGYLITHKPEPIELLFHYSWFDILGLDTVNPNLSRELVMEQKETILFQLGLQFDLKAC